MNDQVRDICSVQPLALNFFNVLVIFFSQTEQTNNLINIEDLKLILYLIGSSVVFWHNKNES
jgi:hypothetical protein